MSGRRGLSRIVYIMVILSMLIFSACSGEGQRTEADGKALEETKESEEQDGSLLSSAPGYGDLAELIDGEAGEYQPYYIRVNRTTNCVTIYELKEETGQYHPLKPMICSVGKEGNTPCGDFKLQERYEWRALFGGVYGQYAVRVVDSILFHSVPYYKESQDALKTEEFDKLGTAASDGCIRLQVADAKWIFDSCQAGTVVTIFDGTTQDDPFPRPEAPVLADTRYPQWDPSDPIEANPWNGGDGDLSGGELFRIWW